MSHVGTAGLAPSRGSLARQLAQQSENSGPKARAGDFSFPGLQKHQPDRAFFLKCPPAVPRSNNLQADDSTIQAVVAPSALGNEWTRFSSGPTPGPVVPADRPPGRIMECNSECYEPRGAMSCGIAHPSRGSESRNRLSELLAWPVGFLGGQGNSTEQSGPLVRITSWRPQPKELNRATQLARG